MPSNYRSVPAHRSAVLPRKAACVEPTAPTEEARQRFGVRDSRFRASADTLQARAAKELLNLVDGAAYLPEREREAEIDTALDDLLAAHHGYSNFHTEPAPARALVALIGQYGNVPEAVGGKYADAPQVSGLAGPRLSATSASSTSSPPNAPNSTDPGNWHSQSAVLPDQRYAHFMPTQRRAATAPPVGRGPAGPFSIWCSKSIRRACAR